MWPLNNLKDWSLDPRVLKKLKGTGFDTLRGYYQHLYLNIPLINVLITRYDADTRSFRLGSAGNHFNIAFGLEDVLYLTGLPIDGKPVTGVEPEDKESVCLRYLGKKEKHSTGSISNISLTWLRENFMTLEVDNEKLSEEELAYHVRAYVLYAIGCTFAPGYNLMVSPVFLPLLENVDDIGSYAWGAAFLANIHDSMKNPTKYTVGFYFPLMIFAYIRFPGLSSVFEIDRTAINEFPLLVSWSHKLKPFKKQKEKHIETFFDSLKEEGGTREEEVKWQPYGELSTNFLPLHLRKQVVLSKSRTILICFNKAVYHRPDKCQRQLGLAGRTLKAKLIEIKTLHRKGSRNGTDWSKKGKYADYISEWEKRFDLLIDRDDLMENDALNSRVDNVNVDHQSPDDTASSRVRDSKDIRSCHPQTGASFLADLQKAAEDTSGATSIWSSFLNTERENSENMVSDDAFAGNGNDDDTEAGLSTRTKSKKRKKTSCGGSDSPSSWKDLSCEELAEKFSSAGKVVWKKLKRVDSTNKELQQQIITLQSVNQALQAEKQELEASHSQKDHALTQLQKNHLDEVSTLKGQLKQVDSANQELQSSNQALQAEKQKLEASHSQKDQALMQLQKNHLDEVSTLIGQLKQKDETLDSHLRSAQETTKKVEEMVDTLNQERAAAILKYKASPRFADEFQIVMAPLLPHGYTLGVDLYKHGQGDETEKRFKELADGQDILAMYKPRSPAQELANAAPDQANASDRYLFNALLEPNAAPPDQAKASNHHLIDALLEPNAAPPDQVKALDHTRGDENVAPTVAEAGPDKCCTESFFADDASSKKTLVLLDNQDPEKDSCPFEEACDALFEIQSPAGDTTSSRVQNSTEIRSCHPQIEAINVKKERVSLSTTTAAAGVVVRAELPLIIDINSDSDSDVSTTDSMMDALVGWSKKS